MKLVKVVRRLQLFTELLPSCRAAELPSWQPTLANLLLLLLLGCNVTSSVASPSTARRSPAFP